MLFIFDWDGTLCRSLDRIVTSVQKSAVDLELVAPQYDQIKSIVGLGLNEAMDLLFPSLSEKGRGQLVERYKHHFVALDISVPSPLYRGAMETLESLRQDKHKLAVATGKSRQGLDRALSEKGMADFFDGTRCADETKSKPHPQMLHELLDELGHQREDAVMIGDTEFDLEMANSAGIRAIGVSHGAHPLPRLEKCRPHLIVDELVTILNHF